MTEITEIELGKTEGAQLNGCFVIIFCRQFNAEGQPAFLVLDRSDNTYGMPGGGIEKIDGKLETFVAAAARETLEETNHQYSDEEKQKLTPLCSHQFTTPNGTLIHTHAMTLEVDAATLQKIADDVPQAKHFYKPGMNDEDWEIKGSKIIPIDAQHTDSELYKFMSSPQAPSVREELLAFFEKFNFATPTQIATLAYPDAMECHRSHRKNAVNVSIGCEPGG